MSTQEKLLRLPELPERYAATYSHSQSNLCSAAGVKSTTLTSTNANLDNNLCSLILPGHGMRR